MEFADLRTRDAADYPSAESLDPWSTADRSAEFARSKDGHPERRHIEASQKS